VAREDPPAWCASASAVAHVLVEVPAGEELGTARVIDGPDGHHLQRARRLGPGEALTVADGRGAWRLYVVEAVEPGRLRLAASGPERREPVLRPRLAVAFALTKGQKPETVVTRLTELGVDEIVVVQARRSMVRWRGDRGPAALARLERVAREAALQCRRARLPVLVGPCDLAEIAARPGVVLAERAEAGPAPGPPDQGWTLVVGPEGGFDDEERALLAGAPRLPVGPHVLRAETAAVAGAALLTAARREA